VTQGLPLGGIGGGGRRGRVPIRVDHGSTSVSTAEDEEHAYDNEEGDDNDFDPRFQSVRSTSVLCFVCSNVVIVPM
jgi:hypothetical protein